MAKIGLLVVTNPSKLHYILPTVKQHIHNILYVKFLPKSQFASALENGEVFTSSPQGPRHSQVVTWIYSQTSLFCKNLDVRILLSNIKDPSRQLISTGKLIEVVIFDKACEGDRANHFIKSCLKNKGLNYKIMMLGGNGLDEDTAAAENHSEETVYENVVLGGTFDRLHSGHKILLSEAVLRCSNTLTVGVTETSMLKGKVLGELIEPCEERMASVLEFLKETDPSLNYQVVPICDPFGPTKHDPSLQMIVVSAETAKGGLKVNEVRREGGLPPLVLYTVALLEGGPPNSEAMEVKLSSSNRRLELLGTRLRPRQVKAHLPSRPYLVGLTGGTCSGKSSIARHLSSLGAGVVDCDSLAHSLYAKDGPCYDDVVHTFGAGILTAEGLVDRRVLGAIVFSDPVQRKVLNDLLWPKLLERALTRCRELHALGHHVVVVDAAVLIQAGWCDSVHEVWGCLLPSEQAVDRLVLRNSLTVEEARGRIEAQPSSAELLPHCDVVLCSLWSTSETQRQVNKAYQLLLSSQL